MISRKIKLFKDKHKAQRDSGIKMQKRKNKMLNHIQKDFKK